MADPTEVAEVVVQGKKPPPSPPDPLAQREQQVGDMLSGLGGQFQGISDRATAAEDKIEARTEGLHPPKLELPPAPTPKQTDPQKVWSSMAMLMAGLGSLMTRQPLTTAMNAAAGVINAYRKGDQEAANAQFATWKVATENAIKIADFQERTYRDILGDAAREERLVDARAARDERAVLAEYTATAHALQDYVAIQRAETEGLQGAERLQLERERLNAELQKQIPLLEQNKAFMDAWGEMQKTPEFQGQDAMGRYRMMRGLLAKTAPGLDSHGDGSDKDMTAARGVYNEELKMYPKDPVTGQVKGAPSFEEFYENVWPNWGEEPEGGTYNYRAGGGSYAGGPVPPQTTDAVSYFEKQGWSHAQASGIVGNLIAESGLQINPPGSNDGGKAYGMAQWHQDRQNDYNQWAKTHGLPDIRHSDFNQQLAFVNYELTQGRFAQVGAQLKNMKTPNEAGALLESYYEMPAGGESVARQRGAAADKVAQQGVGPQKGGTKGQPIPLPQQLRGDPDGARYKHTDGSVWVKRGDHLVPEA